MKKLKFDQICENLGITSIKTTKSIRFPRNIHFSEDFIRAVQREYKRQMLNEDPERPLKNRNEQFLKGLRFVINEVDSISKANKKLVEKKAKSVPAADKKACPGCGKPLYRQKNGTFQCPYCAEPHSKQFVGKE